MMSIVLETFRGLSSNIKAVGLGKNLAGRPLNV